MKKPKIRQSNELFYIQGNEDTESCADYSNITLEYVSSFTVEALG